MENNNEVKIVNSVVDIDENNTSDNTHYIGVMFESKYGSTLDNPKFYGKVYEYKTKKDLKEGQVITIDTKYGKSRVCVIQEFIREQDLNFKDLDLIVEI